MTSVTQQYADCSAKGLGGFEIRLKSPASATFCPGCSHPRAQRRWMDSSEVYRKRYEYFAPNSSNKAFLQRSRRERRRIAAPLLTFFSPELVLTNMEEANKLIGTGKKHLAMGKTLEAVDALHEACGMLGKKYGDTADECGEAFFWCGKALLDLARMENSVLGNALQGVPEEEDEEKPKDSNVEMDSTENLDEKTRDELRVQVYDAMAEKKEDGTLEKKADDADEKTDSAKDEKDENAQADATEKKDEDTGDAIEKVKASQSDGNQTGEKDEDAGDAIEKVKESQSGAAEKAEQSDKPKAEDEASDKLDESDAAEKAEQSDKPKAEDEASDKPDESDENKENIEADMETVKETTKKAEEDGKEDSDQDMEGEEDAEETENGEQEQAEGEDTAEKESDEEEVGNLQLAWEMLEVAKVIYKRKDSKEDQLMAAQTHLTLGEVSAESGNYTQALEDFKECLKLQLKHLEPDSRLLAETYYQLGLTYNLDCQYNQAIEELNSSISVIKSRLEKLQELVDKAEGPEALPDERKEMEELKTLLPEILEKVEDATEGLKAASADTEAVMGAQDGSCSAQNSENSTSTKIKGASSDGQTTVSDISHLVRKKRKPEESPVKEGMVKKVKQDKGQTNEVEETHTNEVLSSNGHSGMEVE